MIRIATLALFAGSLMACSSTPAPRMTVEETYNFDDGVRMERIHFVRYFANKNPSWFGILYRVHNDGDEPLCASITLQDIQARNHIHRKPALIAPGESYDVGSVYGWPSDGAVKATIHTLDYFWPLTEDECLRFQPTLE